MKISLATNFDDSLIDKVRNYPIYEVYGKMKNDFIGGGRPNNELSDIEIDKFEKHVKKVRENGIKFNYLLNGSCISNREQDIEWQNKFKEFLKYLSNVGVNALTVSNPFVLQFIKKYFKDEFTVRVSTFACVDSYTKAKYWEDMGADYICADFVKINRDFNELEYMVKHLKKAKIEILVTNSCLKNCPMIYTHTNGLSHASENSVDKIKYEDWGLLFCQKKELEDLSEYIKSPWVRPEDIEYYEKIGIENFKITERSFPTDELVKRVKAYTDRCYNGNLLDLVQGHGVVKKDNLQFEKYDVITRSDIYNEIKRVRGLGVPRECDRHIYIDNKKLDGFINFFALGKCTGRCEQCGYCKKIAKNSIIVNKEVRNYLLDLYNKFDNAKI